MFDLSRIPADNVVLTPWILHPHKALTMERLLVTFYYWQEDVSLGRDRTEGTTSGYF